jgi:hypothetical protein
VISSRVNPISQSTFHRLCAPWQPQAHALQIFTAAIQSILVHEPYETALLFPLADDQFDEIFVIVRHCARADKRKTKVKYRPISTKDADALD